MNLKLEATSFPFPTRRSRGERAVPFGPEGQTPDLDPARADYHSFMAFSNPDGNGWLIQEVKQRDPRR